MRAPAAPCLAQKHASLHDRATAAPAHIGETVAQASRLFPCPPSNSIEISHSQPALTLPRKLKMLTRDQPCAAQTRKCAPPTESPLTRMTPFSQQDRWSTATTSCNRSPEPDAL